MVSDMNSVLNVGRSFNIIIHNNWKQIKKQNENVRASNNNIELYTYKYNKRTKQILYRKILALFHARDRFPFVLYIHAH